MSRHPTRIRRSLKRVSPSRLPKRKFILICEGKNTEPEYFRSLQALFRTSLIEIEATGQGGDPSAVVAVAKTRMESLKREAKRSKDSNDSNFEVWIVVDVDEHVHLRTAIEAAKHSDIGVAVSNPCFEIWIKYHFQDWNGPVSNKEACRNLETHIPGYTRNGKVFVVQSCGDRREKQCQSVIDACLRAERSVAARRDEGDEGGNPSSTCHELVRKLLPSQEL